MGHNLSPMAFRRRGKIGVTFNHELQRDVPWSRFQRRRWCPRRANIPKSIDNRLCREETPSLSRAVDFAPGRVTKHKRADPSVSADPACGSFPAGWRIRHHRPPLPDGWFFRRDVSNSAIAYFVSRENIDAKGFFETGLSLNVLADPVGGSRGLSQGASSRRSPERTRHAS
jgi:hypothetical protein